jgi:hypothetical protein
MNEAAPMAVVVTQLPNRGITEMAVALTILRNHRRIK